MIREEGRMCRKCYNAYDWCSSLLKTLKATVVNAVDVLQPNVIDDAGSILLASPVHSNRSSNTPKRNDTSNTLSAPKRLCLLSYLDDVVTRSND